MNIKELDARFLKLTDQGGHKEVDTLQDAQGIEILCPGCFLINGGKVGTHRVIAWFAGRGVPDEAKPGPGRWQISGSDLDNITLSPSIDVGCWHGFIVAGNTQN